MNKTKEKKLMTAKCVIAAVFVMVLIMCVSNVFGNTGQRKINRLLDLGNKYLEDMDYEDAILVFDQAIAIDPKCEEAYLGKAQAQYVLGQYEDAIATLQEGIAKVDDGSRLESFLKQILDEITEENRKIDSGSIEAEKGMEKALTLNYVDIVRFVDTQDAEIQLEVLGDEGNEENYTWNSTAPEYAEVSSSGLVTCKPAEGTTEIYAEDEYGNTSNGCTVHIYPSDNGFGENESETIKVKINEGEEEQEYAVLIDKKDGDEVARVDVLGKRIYYSGDITIPETLQFMGKEIEITGLTNQAFRWSDELNSIYIPATVSNLRDEHEIRNPFYYCANLKEIKVAEDSKFLKAEDGVLYSKDGIVLYSYPAGKEDSSYTLPKEVREVYPGAFLGCKNLKEILVEDGNECYESMGGTLIDKDSQKMVAYPIGNGLKSFIVPENVKELDENVFYNSILEEVDCSSVEIVYTTAFRQCNMLKKILGGENTINIGWYGDPPVKIEGFSKMRKLERLSFTLSEDQDLNELSALESLRDLNIQADSRTLNLNALSSLSNLSSLSISRLATIEDLSWVEGMVSLESINISARECKVTDLTPLLKMKELRFIRIDCTSSDKDELSPNMKKQVQELKEQWPEANIYIWE